MKGCEDEDSSRLTGSCCERRCQHHAVSADNDGKGCLGLLPCMAPTPEESMEETRPCAGPWSPACGPLSSTVPLTRPSALRLSAGLSQVIEGAWCGFDRLVARLSDIQLTSRRSTQRARACCRSWVACSKRRRSATSSASSRAHRRREKSWECVTALDTHHALTSTALMVMTAAQRSH